MREREGISAIGGGSGSGVGSAVGVGVGVGWAVGVGGFAGACAMKTSASVDAGRCGMLDLRTGVEAAARFGLTG
ncbi:MAG: hypothetical protein HY595_06120, partial [Candidatus Omnitrophica bacterium]|nr:hypothetical protein [Candidatus Omnitrophota bacterium]